MSKIKILILGKRKDQISSYKSFSRPRASLFAIIFAAIAGIAIYFSFAASPKAPLAKGAVVTCATAQQTAPLLASAGVKWVRVQTLPWSSTEYDRGKFSNDHLDRYKACYDIFHSYGIKTLALIDNTPQWAAQNPNRQQNGVYFPLQPPANDQDFADYLSYAVPYLGNSVDAWEIYNEPDLNDFWVANNPQPDYLNLLKTAYTAIKTADQKAGLNQQVIMGGLATVVSDNNGWVDYLFSNGAYNYTDALTLHAYPGDNCSSAAGDPRHNFYDVIHNDRVTADKYRGSHAQIPVWITEFDYAGCAGNGNSSASQGQLLSQFLDYYDHGTGKSDDLAAVNWFTADSVILGDTNSGMTTTQNGSWRSSRILDDPYINDTTGPWRIGPQAGLNLQDVKIDWGDGTSERQTAPNFPHVYAKYGNYTTHITMEFTSGQSRSFDCLVVVRTNSLAPSDCPSIQLLNNNRTVTAKVGSSPWLIPTPVYSALKAWPANSSAPSARLSVDGTNTPTVSLAADSSYSNIKQVEYDSGKGVLQTVTSYPFQLDMTKLQPGPYDAVVAVVSDYTGQQTTSNSVAFSIPARDDPPSVSIISPKDGATISGTVSITAKASDEGSVSDVIFKLDDATIGDLKTSTSTSYIDKLDTTHYTNGSHQLSVTAIDNTGHSATANETVTIANTDKVAPTVSITSPTNKELVKGPVINIRANASDNVGVQSVQFKVNGKDVGSADTSEPYSTAWTVPADNASSSTYKLTAIAKDFAGNTTTSDSVAITIDNQPPKGSITSPAGGATVSGGKVKIAANASDNLGVKYVQFTLTGSDGLPAALGTQITKAPYEYTWDTTTLANGHYAIGAIVTDKADNSTTVEQVKVTVKNVPPTPDITPPTVPTALVGSSDSTTTVSLSWKASKDPATNNGAIISGVGGYEIWRDGKYLTTVSQASYVDQGLTQNTHYKYAVLAFDNAGNKSKQSTPLSITTLPPLPTVTFGSVAGTRIRGTVNLSATADSKASISSVQFTLDGAPVIGDDASPPYAVSWDTTKTADGPHKITAVATDSSGQKSKPSEWDVVVDNTKPSVSIVSPKDKGKVKGTVKLSAKAGDNDAIDSVQFMIDGTKLLGTADSQAPYSYEWYSPNYGDGAHTITAVAKDKAGNKTTSAAINITIKNKGSGSGDQIAPSIPANLASGTITQNSIALSWNASVDNPGGSGLAGYVVYRNGSELTTSEQTSFTDTNLSPGTAYTYAVAALDKSSNLSDQTSVLTLTTQSLAIQPGDSNGDGKVDVSDLSTLLHYYKGTNQNCDFNHDGKIDVADLSILLSNYGRKYR